MSISRSMASSTIIVIALVVASFVVYISSRAPIATSCSASNTCAASTNSGMLSGTYSTQGANQTVVAAYVSTLTSLTTTKTTTTLTATSSTVPQSSPPGGAFTYSPTSSVMILSVSATTSQGQSGNRALSFSVLFQNIGGTPIYIVSGGGSSLSVTSLSGTSVANQTQKVRCEMAEAFMPLNPGENHASYAPGCWSGYTYLLLRPGTIQVQLSLSWSNDSSLGQMGNTEITVEFALN